MNYNENSVLSRPLSVRGQQASEQPIGMLMSTALQNLEMISLAAGFVDNTSLPTDLVAESTATVLSSPESGRRAMQYGTNDGLYELRQAIAGRNFSGDADEIADRMILTAGSNQMLHLVSECLLDAGDIVLCGAPTYFVYMGLLKDCGVRAFGVESDDQGMIPASLDESLAELEAAGELPRVKAVYLIPYSDNPGGTTMPAPRRQELIAVMRRWNEKTSLTLLVDNAYRDLRYEGEDVPSMLDLGADPEWTIETGTFSKNFAPGIRVGWGVLPQWLREPVSQVKAVIDFGSAHLNQNVMLDLINSGRFDLQVARLREVYSRKLTAMLDACAEHLGPIDGVRYRAPTGGLYVWVQLPEGIDASPGSPLWVQCTERGVLYVPGEFCFPTEGAAIQKNSMRLSFGVQQEEPIAQGIRILGEAIANVLSMAAV